MILPPFYLCCSSEFLEGSEFARRFCYRILRRRLRSGTLRPTLSGGLPFSSFNWYSNSF